jgi:hypothetical protein
MQKFLVSIFFLLIVAVVPNAAHAVSATMTAIDTVTGQVTTCVFPDSGTDTLDLSGVSCGGFDFDSGSEAAFVQDANGVGQLVLHNTLVTNNNSGPATLKIDYQHTNAATDPTQVQCTGMSMDGWFTTPSFDTAVNDTVQLSMEVIYTQNGATAVTQSVSGNNPGFCTVPDINGFSPLLYQVPNTTDSSFNFYTPQLPQQVIQQLNTCNSCDPGAIISKHFTVTLAPGDSNTFVGSSLGAICQVVPASGKKPKPADFAKCTASVGGLLYTKEAKFNFKAGNCCNQAGSFDSGTDSGDLLGAKDFKVASVNIDPATGLPECSLFVGNPNEFNSGAPAIHATFGDFNKDGFPDIRMQFDNTTLFSGVPNPIPVDFVSLVCSANINNKSQTVITGDVFGLSPK